MNNRFGICALLLVSAIVSNSALAKPLDKMMGDIFDDMITQSVPGSESSSAQGRMGYYYGGSFQARVPTYSPEVVHITPPNLSTGCNGIDANFGALSFLDGADLKQLLRSTVQQGATYAFGLALQAICGSCLAEMKALAAKVNALSANLLDSCEAGRYAVNSLLEAEWGEGGETGMKTLADTFGGFGYGSGADSLGSKLVSTGAGLTEYLPFDPTSLFSGTDPFENMRGVAARNPLEALNDRDAGGGPMHPEALKATYVNVVYKALEVADISAWWTTLSPSSAPEKKEHYRFLTSLYGSRVYYPIHEGGKTVAASYNWPPLHDDLTSLLPSNQGQGADNVVAPGSTINLTMYKCKGLGLSPNPNNSDYPAELCLDKEATLDTMTVDNVAGKVSGYVQELSANIGKRDGTVPSAELKAFMVNDPMQSATLLEIAGKNRFPLEKKLSQWGSYSADVMFVNALEETHNAVKDAGRFLPSEIHVKELSVLTDAFEKRLAALKEEVFRKHGDLLSHLNGVTVWTELLKDVQKRESSSLSDIPATN